MPDLYPGELATAEQILRLADEYRNAAEHLLTLGRRGDPLSRAPYRLSAIHAIELYLNALLLHAKHSPAQIRGMQHNLSRRIELAIAKGLRLRKRTEAHLLAMTSSREYLATRYDAEMRMTTSQINRLTATLNEVSGKTVKIVNPAH